MWLYGGKPFDEKLANEYVGFVYLIYNYETDRFYVGKKRFKKVHTFQVKKKKKRKMVESDWKTYTGSNKILNEELETNIDTKLNKEILHLCTSLGWMSYKETLEILKRDAMQSDDYYNEWCSCKIHRKHLK